MNKKQLTKGINMTKNIMTNNLKSAELNSRNWNESPTIFEQMQNMINRRINEGDDFFNYASNQRVRLPKVETRQLTNHYLSWVEMPGVKIDNVDIKVIKNSIIMTGTKRTQPQTTAIAKESEFDQPSSSLFEAHLNFDEEIDAAKIEASFEDGILQLLVPKKNPVIERKIKVNSGAGAEFRRVYEAAAKLNEIHFDSDIKKKVN
jgi:HSP20 family protein